MLYEDSRGPSRGFGPHALLVSCVHDDVGGARAAIEDRLEAIPKKGDSKLLAACRDDAAALGRGAPVVAVFDDDRVRRLLTLATDTAKRDVAVAIVDWSGRPPGLVAWMLVRNLESLVIAAAAFYSEPVPPKKPAARDRLLQRAAFGDRLARQRLRKAMPTFDCLVVGVSRLLACP